MSTGISPKFRRSFWQLSLNTTKAPEGGLAATLRGKKVRSFLLIIFGVCNLECHCHVTLSANIPDNNAYINPRASPAHIHVCARELLSCQLLNFFQRKIRQRTTDVICRCGNNQILIFFAVHMNISNQLCTKEVNAGVQILFQVTISLSQSVGSLAVTCADT